MGGDGRVTRRSGSPVARGRSRLERSPGVNLAPSRADSMRIDGATDTRRGEDLDVPGIGCHQPAADTSIRRDPLTCRMGGAKAGSTPLTRRDFSRWKAASPSRRDPKEGGPCRSSSTVPPGKGVFLQPLRASFAVSRSVQYGDGGVQDQFRLRVLANAAIPRIKPWSAEVPSLYTAVVTLRDRQGKEVESVGVRVGFRSIEIAGRELRINGQAAMIHGCNRHEHNGNRRLPARSLHASPGKRPQDRHPLAGARRQEARPPDRRNAPPRISSQPLHGR